MGDTSNIVLLGATGSIGDSTLKVIRSNPDRFKLVGIAANTNKEKLEKIAREFAVPNVRLYADSGLPGLMELSQLDGADVVIVATTGTIAVKPTIAALQSGKRVGLANKETLVLAGSFVMPVAQASTGQLLPVDSEHNAIFQCLQGMHHQRHLNRILLTASGGPFLHHTMREMEHVTVKDALQHPNWDMGVKVTIDSASMANKGLEMIEAHWLFGIEPASLSVVIHPQSIIHSMVEFTDGSIIAQMAPPSMTFPIQHVLAYPDRCEPAHPTLDLDRIHQLELRPPDMRKFPCLRLAGDSLRAGGLAPAVYNAANEVAVQAFVDKAIPFLKIPELIDACLQNANFPTPSTVDELLDLQNDLRQLAEVQLKTLA